MTKYREILRLASLGLSQQSIADSIGVSKKTVRLILSVPIAGNDYRMVNSVKNCAKLVNDFARFFNFRTKWSL